MNNEKLFTIEDVTNLLKQMSSYISAQELVDLNRYDYNKWIKYRDDFIDLSINSIIPPIEVREAQKFIANCHKDMGFMGSPKYYQQKKIVDDYYEKNQNELEKLEYERLKLKYE
jgi:hypothetical protein